MPTASLSLVFTYSFSLPLHICLYPAVSCALISVFFQLSLKPAVHTMLSYLCSLFVVFLCGIAVFTVLSAWRLSSIGLSLLSIHLDLDLDLDLDFGLELAIVCWCQSVVNLTFMSWTPQIHIINNQFNGLWCLASISRDFSHRKCPENSFGVKMSGVRSGKTFRGGGFFTGNNVWGMPWEMSGVNVSTYSSYDWTIVVNTQTHRSLSNCCTIRSADQFRK